ncbi:MAG: Crp/Fnr family transcriptional regulator [Kastovskya adunca ATA6-11-RM4]|nr:Crp/Fnr family transcriptional regulator [Kastovskya adunca ATA6-11-RM4]
MSESFHNSSGNKLLAALPREDYERLLPYLESVFLDFKQYLYLPNQPIEYVYFPLDGIISLLTVLGDGGTIEVATVGNEGMIGIPVLLGVDQLPAETMVQVPGKALRMQVDVFKREVPVGSSFHKLLLLYVQARVNHLMQSAGCNRLHSIEQRCCRWLLLTQDRVATDEFPLTQEFLSQMLGVRRASVSEVAATLQKEGLIRYNRGKMKVIDRERLKATSCECYQVFTEEYERILGFPPIKNEV